MIYRFGAFELDDARFELRHRGTAAEVQPKVLRLLLHLVQHRERAVGVDELLRELWPDEVVGQGSVKRAVRGARSVLMSFGGEEAWIRTVPRYGYQFVAEVSVNGAEAARPLAPAQPVREGLLGREGVMALLEESLQQALAGTSGCVLIAGSPGLGKTRTIETLLAHAHALGADAWAGRCTEIEGAPAFWPFIQVFREALRDRGAERLRALLGSEGADIASSCSTCRSLCRWRAHRRAFVCSIASRCSCAAPPTSGRSCWRSMICTAPIRLRCGCCCSRCDRCSARGC
jgi:DNA-binding winged helix-turn-helix (wHTH) protein